MPAFYTHLAFGTQIFRAMSANDRNLIGKHPNVFRLGTSGPDIFFYDVLGRTTKLGEQIHTQRCGSFLQNLVKQAELLNGNAREIMMTYVAGFVTHYLLDSRMHPYVYARICDKAGWTQEGEHFLLEAALDAYFSRKILKKRPSQMKQYRLVKVEGEKLRIIADGLTEAYNETFPEQKLGKSVIPSIWKRMYVIMRLIDDPTGIKENAFSGVERILIGKRLVSPLFVNDHTYQFGEQLWREFDPVYESTLEEGKHIFEIFGKEMEREKLFSMLGNRSYHTGEEC